LYFGDLSLNPRQHDDNEWDWMISPTVTIPEGGTAQLSYLHRYDIEEGYDYGRAFVTTDLNTWTQINEFSNENQPWQLSVTSLNPWAGKHVKLAWFFVADGGVVEEGWYVDEIIVHGGPWISAIAPNPANAGDEVLVTGSGFSTGWTIENPHIYFGGVEVTPTEWTDKGIRFVLPGDAITGEVTVESRGAVSPAHLLKVKLPKPTIGDIGQIADQ
jgi:hypothetical protein